MSEHDLFLIALVILLGGAFGAAFKQRLFWTVAFAAAALVLFASTLMP